MGLDVSVYRAAKPVANDRKWDAGCFRVFANPDFPNREKPLEDGKVYESGDLPDDTPDIYSGYMGYNRWRDQLAEMAGYPRGSDASSPHCEVCWDGAQGPFAELLNFSDCEGDIGADVAKKLAGDFAAFQDRADAFAWDKPELYNKFRRAFEIASDGGCVKFH